MFTRADGSTCANKEELLIEASTEASTSSHKLSRYRHVWPRQMNADRIEKREPHCIMEDFYKEYRTKIVKWAKAVTRQFHLPLYVYEDLTQAALLQVWKNIPGWVPDKANLWTYSYLGMHKNMLAVVREYHSNKRWVTGPITYYIEAQEDTILRDCAASGDSARLIEEISYKHSPQMDTYERLTIRRIVQRRLREHPRHMQRLLDVVVSEHTYADLARLSEKRISKQGYYHSVQYARKMLKSDLEASYV